MSNLLSRVMKAVIALIISTAVGAAVVGRLLTAIGFGAVGIVANSLAARWQSRQGNVARGSTFASLQATRAGIGR
ncbi:hypothetical protein F5B19DRAFT_16013 [Rostrohypoxylon terebratum]|nr:hypothetical protein F5B19DRAFT_16013 [Rostrohypoxylon terebratum]